MSGYIGTQPVPQATQTRDSFTATSGQTSFATGGYTPNFLDVYLNGVKLAAADYTATNGSDVVLASGAATGDILEVVAYTTFEISGVTGLTPSIDDNGNATAITIDSNENVLVGTTSMTASDTSGTGMMYANGVALRVKRESSGGGQPCLDLNNTGSDDVMAMFRKDGVTVGSIGTTGGDVTIDGGSEHTGLRFEGTQITPRHNGAYSNNWTGLGTSSNRFKDLYLGDGVYLGGTGAANKLDDYEEGTWTPSCTVGSVSSGTGNYTKVGRLVTITAYLGGFSNTTNNEVLIVSNLPFTGGVTSSVAGNAMWAFLDKDFGYEIVYYDGSSQIRFYHSTNGNFDSLRHIDLDGSSSEVYFTATYQVA